MIKTRDFIFVHLPKTAGTWLRSAIRYCYTRSSSDLFLHRLRRRLGFGIPGYPYSYEEAGQHLTARKAPWPSHGLPFVSCIRDPLQGYVSRYRFGHWKRFPEDVFGSAEQARASYPNFPDLSFPEFASAFQSLSPWARHMRSGLGVGPFSTQFVSYFCDDPPAVWAASPDYPSLLRNVRARMLRVSFLFQLSVEQDFKRFLDACRPLRALETFPGFGISINTSRGAKLEVPEELAEEIRSSERLIYDLFPELGAEQR